MMTIWWQVFGAMAVVFAIRSLGDDGYDRWWALMCALAVMAMAVAAAFPSDRSDK